FRCAVCKWRGHFARQKQLTYKRPFPDARYCVQSGRTSIGRPPHSLHLRRQRSAGISIALDQPEASTIASRPHPHFTSIDAIPNALPSALRNFGVAPIAEVMLARKTDDVGVAEAYSKLKAYLRKIAERTVAGLMRALETCTDIFKPAQCTNYFAACG